ncbi:MAG: hypothetical protein HQK79_11335 [Desulfobacterales bacterium]|nr:hypothetical protein [Desulfobacterales bacterium]
MGEGFRDTMTNIGDILVEQLEKGYDFLKQSTNGIVKAYNMRVLKTKKTKITTNIGERLIQVRDGSPCAEIFKDDTLLALFEKLSDIETTINNYKE